MRQVFNIVDDFTTGREKIIALRCSSATTMKKKSPKTDDEKRAYRRQYYLKNKEKLKKCSREYHAKNKEKINVKTRERHREYRERDRDGVNAKQRERKQANRTNVLISNKRWAENNAEYLRERRSEYYRQNREIILSNTQAKYKNDPIWREKKLARNREWVKNNPLKVLASVHQYRVRFLKARGTCSAEQLKERVNFFGAKCAYCGGPFNAIDHVIPLSKGGTHWPANLRPACKSCNSHKSASNWREWKFKL